MLWLGASVINLMIYVGARCRKTMNRYRYTGEGAIVTPMAEALGQLVGIAGGIYVSLVLLCEFLGVEELEKIEFFDMMLDPLALISLVLASIQPIGLWLMRRRGR